MEAMWFALGMERLAHTGIVIDREAIDTCACCGVSYRRKNATQHYWSGRHRRAFIRQWKATK